MPKIIGVSFSDTHLDAAVIEYRFRMVKPLKTFSVSLPSDKDGRNSVLLETFRAWKSEISPAGITIGLPLKYFLFQSLEMPVMKKRDMEKALAFELEKYLPLPVEEYSFDFFSLSPVDKQQKVIILAIKRETIQALAAVAEEAGLSLLSVTCNALSAFAAVREIDGQKNMQGLCISTVEDGFEIAGISGALPVFLRHYPKSRPLVDVAEELLPQYPGKVFFAGNADATLPGRWDSRKFHISVAHAIATTSLQRLPFRLDFLPKEFGRLKKDYYPVLLSGIAAASVMLFILTGAVRYFKDFSALRSIESRISSIRETASPLIEAQKKLDALQNDRQVLISFQKKSNMAIRVLADLSRLLPKDAWVVNFSADDNGRVECEGIAFKSTRLVIDLENSESFKNVTFSSPVMAKEGEERFSIKMEVEGN